MSAPRRRYARVAIGIVETLPASIRDRAKPSALTLFLWLPVSPLRRNLPGVLRAGEASLADALDWPLTALRRCLRELEDAGVVRYDRSTKVLVVPTALAHDPPANANVLKAWASDLAELPACALTTNVIPDAVLDAVVGHEKGPELAETWRNLTTEHRNGSPKGLTNGSGDGRGTPIPIPIPIPIPMPIPVPVPDPQPQPPPDAERLARYTRAWDRVPEPFAAAAADDFILAAQTLSEETFGRLCRQLVRSKWRDAQKWRLFGPVPTLRRLLEDARYRQRILNGRVASTPLYRRSVSFAGATTTRWSIAGMRHDGQRPPRQVLPAADSTDADDQPHYRRPGDSETALGVQSGFLPAISAWRSMAGRSGP